MVFYYLVLLIVVAKAAVPMDRPKVPLNHVADEIAVVKVVFASLAAMGVPPARVAPYVT